MCEKSEERRRFVQEHYLDMQLTTPEECQDFVLRICAHGESDRLLEVAGTDDTFRLEWRCARLNVIVTVVAFYSAENVKH